MTHRPIQVLPDGQRRYADYHRYTPMSPEERTNTIRKPDDPRAVRFHTKWFLPLEVISEDQRAMPETRPDEEAIEHLGKEKPCRCNVCKRPGTQEWLSRRSPGR